ncbi:hypothetical protein M2345_000510 [Sphingobium sp. B8D3D]|nr:hypothetical protein [Sphingobium sp. B8D3D]MCW2416959.1 hypothetical protein [Sphingobium sp. B8D3A]
MRYAIISRAPEGAERMRGGVALTGGEIRVRGVAFRFNGAIPPFLNDEA